MGSRWIAAGMAAIAVAAGAAGCGGSSSDDDKTTASTTATTPTMTTAAPSTSAPTNDDFVLKASAICRDARTRSENNTYPTAPAGFPAWGRRLEAIHDERIAALAALTPPESQQEQYEQLMQHLRRARAQLKGLIAKLAAGARLDELGAEGRANGRELALIARLTMALDIPDCRL